MSGEAPKSVTPMSGSEFSSTNSERTLVDVSMTNADANAEDEENMSSMAVMLYPQGSHMLGKHPLEVGSVSTIPSNQEETLNQEMVLGKEEVPIPEWMKALNLYRDGDWKVFREIGGHKNWFYNHRKYKTMFRARSEVKLFMETTLSTGTDIFKGRKLRKKGKMSLILC
uniref:Uncharacterized protein n=1 Tax=Leersia perrieri TaxID=77586 RepID=A0A0D9VV93_9ORYZ